ncbi:MAG: adenosylcobalamin-dependent ribonucleoside-diphosphate reductase [Planctomycetia bacterium]|nr:MAG: adenosylcobalamin-dependent ribonucleoside-diphosphate reductase [Planctomycetia bacterium]
MVLSSHRPAATLMDEPTLSENARKVLEARYLKKNEQGDCVEGPGALFQRVAAAIAAVEPQYGGSEAEQSLWTQRFYSLMVSGAFMPNSPTLMNAGREMGMLSACFVLPVRDSISGIFDSIKHTALIQKAGGGTGFAFDELRPTGDFIRSSGGTTSGPITFWRAFSEATNAIQQGAFRRGANMGMMYVHHPDILKFLHAKQDLSQFTNYNISVKITDQWMKEFLADADSPHFVRNPRNGRVSVIPRDVDIWKYDVRTLIDVDCCERIDEAAPERYFTSPRQISPLPEALRGRVIAKRDIWEFIIRNAWQTGEPGVVFIDRINETNPTPHIGRMEATNPCGEQPLLPYEACNLGSVNLGLFVTDACTPDARVDWDRLREAVHWSTRFLDNVIDANEYPLEEIDRICKANRKIGLGIMGFADALYKLGVPYNSDEGVAWGEKFMKFVNDEAHNYSEHLARTRGCFPNWKGSHWQTLHNRLMRNACTTTVAPTGTISIIANCSGGIEPMFSLAFIRNVLRGQKQGERPLVESNDTFVQVARARGFYSEALMERIAREGTVAHIDEVPEDIQRVFVCAHDIAPVWHMKMQAAFQRHCDSSISKTINFPHTASVEDVDTIYRLAFDMRCKGVTVYRDGCRAFQPMALKDEKPAAAAAPSAASVAASPAARVAEAPVVASASPATFAAPAVARPAARGAEAPPQTVAPATLAGIAPAVAVAVPSVPSVPSGAAVPSLQPRDLPEIVSGLRIRQLTPFGNMHVKITVDPRRETELEVFAQLGKGGDVATSDLEAICRMISLWLRAGGSLRHVIKQLEGIGSSLQIPTRAGRIMSLGDGLACALKKYTRAKERFGLRAMLLGDIDLGELYESSPAPHHRSDVGDRLAPSRPATDDGPRNGGPAAPRGGDPVISAPSVTISSATRTATASEVTLLSKRLNGGGSLAGSSESIRETVQRAANGTDVRNGALATATIEETVEFNALEARINAELDDLLVRGEISISAVETRESVRSESTEAADAGEDVGSGLLHVHDNAQFFKLHCPQCDSQLAMQEGCKKCLGCGWSAC